MQEKKKKKKKRERERERERERRRGKAEECVKENQTLNQSTDKHTTTKQTRMRPTFFLLLYSSWICIFSPGLRQQSRLQRQEHLPQLQEQYSCASSPESAQHLCWFSHSKRFEHVQQQHLESSRPCWGYLWWNTLLE